MLIRIADHHLNIIPAPLDPQNLFSVKGLAYLARKPAHGHPNGARTGFNPQLFLLLAGSKIVGNVIGAGIGFDFLFELIGGQTELVKILST